MENNRGCIVIGPSCTGNFKSVVQKSRQESAHAHTLGGDLELHARILVANFWTTDQVEIFSIWLHSMAYEHHTQPEFTAQRIASWLSLAKCDHTHMHSQDSPNSNGSQVHRREGGREGGRDTYINPL